MPERKISPEKTKEDTPKPLWINKSLTQAPNLLSQFLASTSLEPIWDSVLWSSCQVNKKERNAIQSKMPIINKKLPKTNFC